MTGKPTLDDKAADLVDACRLFIGIIAGRLRKDFPLYFWPPTVFDRFIFHGTVACVACTCVHLHAEVANEKRTPLELMAQEQLREWHPDSMGAYQDIHRLVSERLPAEPDRSKRRGLMFELAAEWVVDKSRQCGETLHDRLIVDSLAAHLAEASSGYWTAT